MVPAPPPVERPGTVAAGTGPALSMVEPGAARVERAAPMTGSCSFARPPGKAHEYHTRLRIVGAPNQAITVHQQAAFYPDRLDVIGTLATGALVWGRGPVKHSADSPGIGYAILVSDASGQVCLGYVDQLFARPER